MLGRRELLRRGSGLLAAGAATALTSRAAGADTGSNPRGRLGSACPPIYVGIRPAPSAEVQAACDTGPLSFLDNRTLVTVYGRSFGVAPVLGMLGRLESFDELEEATRPWTETIRLLNSRRSVTLAPHLLYALARGCQEPGDACLIMLDGSGVDIISEYIEPARERGMAVVLDAQIGRSTAPYLIRRMIDRGYLAYPNVHVALDPEYATGPDQTMPGHPIGYLTADEINEAQDLLATYVRDENLLFKKMLMVHQFVDDQTDSWTMISNKQAIEVFDEVDLVINADGFGTPDAKVMKYNGITDPSAYPRLNWRAIKIFHENPIAPRFADSPVMTPRQIFGLDPTPGGLRMWAGPHALVLG